MIRSFASHLQDSKKVYSFKMRMAFECTTAMHKKIECALDAYQLESITKPKSLPIQEDSVNFPQLGPVEINIIEMELGYPVIPEMLHSLLIERCQLDGTRFRVHTMAQDADRTPQIGIYEKGDALLNTELEEAELTEKVYGNEFVTDFLDSIETRKMEFAGDAEDKAPTTNDLPQGTQSPMTSQNKLPTAGDM
jgi:hypothetical protein